ncbi:MAG: 4Fe-4S dicluster domain-containing protein [Syntrophomonadaceae bacterium]|jgi:epoxyqueuosine reductase
MQPDSNQPSTAQANDELRARIVDFCRTHGADLLGFAPVQRWDDFNEVPLDFRPRSLFPPAKTVIVIGMAMPLPIVETTPSFLHLELYTTCNRELDGIAFNLTRYLNRQGTASYFFTRDGYGSLSALKQQPYAAFGHTAAARYAGLGTVGLSHNLLTPEYGPRVRFVSVFTAVELQGDPVITKDLCIQCGACAKCCPKGALEPREDQIIGDFNVNLCIDQHIDLVRRKCYPCGICIKVCPIGKDRALYKQKGIVKKYLQETDALAANPNDPQYRSWTHVRRYGSRSLD